MRKTTILHLSDLQFGRHHANDANERPPLYNKDQYDAEASKLISDFKILKGQGVQPKYLVLSGDIAETSSHSEYTLAKSFIDRIVEFFAIDKQNVIIVPGNHDVNRNLCHSARLRAKEFGDEFIPPYPQKFEVFNDFIKQFYSDLISSSDAIKYSFDGKKLFNINISDEEKIAFIGLNSCIDESEESPHYGNITVEQANKAFKELNSLPEAKKYQKIVVLHHNIIRDSDCDEENLKDADEILPIFIKNKVNLILHGHQHLPKNQVTGSGNNIIPVLATGSAGLDSDTLPENCRRYQVIELFDNKIRIYRRRFDYKQIYLDGKGCWTSDIAPEEQEIFSEFETVRKSSKKKSSNNYDLYKIEVTDNALRGRDILILAYPRREISKVDGVLDHKRKIYYEYLSVKVELNFFMYFLFVGKHINITATVTHFLQNNPLPSSGLTICTPRISSKGEGDSTFRATNIENKIREIIYEENETKSYLLRVNFIDDYVWENCLDLSFRKKKTKVPELTYYIDQNIYKVENEKEIQLGLCLDFFDRMFEKQYDDDDNNNNKSSSILTILASGGMGKSTLCDKIFNVINSFEKKKAIYINAEDIKSKLELINHDIKTISDLFQAYDIANGSRHITLHDPNNLEINISCGNIVVIIDGLDEIESALIDQFDIDAFLDSISKIDNYFNNCRLLITSRDYHKEKYVNRDNIDIFHLKGFEDENVRDYFNKRFSSNSKQL